MQGRQLEVALDARPPFATIGAKLLGYIDSGNMKDYHDHYYPSEMSVDAILQTYTINRDKDAFLARFDKDWKRYNRDIIREVASYAKKEAK